MHTLSTSPSASVVRCESGQTNAVLTISIPWNYPLMMWAWKVAPALAAGCCVIMKPSELTPITALVMCELAKEAGFPAGVINTVPGLGATTGDAISRHMDIDKVGMKAVNRG